MADDSDIEAKMHDAPVAHDIFLAFQAHFPRVLGAMLALAGDEVVVSDYLCANEAFFEVGMDYARGLRCGAAALHRPCTDLLRPGREVSFQAKQFVPCMDQPIEPGLGEP